MKKLFYFAQDGNITECETEVTNSNVTNFHNIFLMFHIDNEENYRVSVVENKKVMFHTSLYGFKKENLKTTNDNILILIKMMLYTHVYNSKFVKKIFWNMLNYLASEVGSSDFHSFFFRQLAETETLKKLLEESAIKNNIIHVANKYLSIASIKSIEILLMKKDYEAIVGIFDTFIKRRRVSVKSKNKNKRTIDFRLKKRIN